MPGFLLVAEYSGGSRRELGHFPSLRACLAEYERLEKWGRWPTGFDVIAEGADGSAWFYADFWEQYRNAGEER